LNVIFVRRDHQPTSSWDAPPSEIDEGGTRLVQWLPDKLSDVEDDLEILSTLSGPNLTHHGAHCVVQPRVPLVTSQVGNAAHDFSPVRSAGPRVAVPGKQDRGAVIGV
jgi:hypothetical protein